MSGISILLNSTQIIRHNDGLSLILIFFFIFHNSTTFQSVVNLICCSITFVEVREQTSLLHMYLTIVENLMNSEYI